MPIKAYNPTTPARRGMTSEDYSQITTKKPLKSLIKSKKQNAGRNNTGRITVRHRGGGVKRHYRLLNHKLAPGLTVTVEEIESWIISTIRPKCLISWPVTTRKSSPVRSVFGIEDEI